MFASKMFESSLLTQPSQPVFSQVLGESLDTQTTDNTCLACSHNITEKQWAWECAGCNHWVHHTCDSTMSGAVYRALVQQPTDGLLYFCTQCRIAFPKPITPILKAMCSIGVQTVTSYADACQGTIDNQSLRTSPITMTMCSIGVQTASLYADACKGLANNNSILNSLLPKLPPPKPTLKPKPALKNTGPLKNPLIVNAPLPITTTPEISNPTHKKALTSVHRGNTTEPSYHLSVIVFNLNEPVSQMLHEREAEDLLNWALVCKQLNLADLEVPRLQRLSRGPSNANADKPRLIKATFTSVDSVQRLLLASSDGKKHNLGEVRIRVDLTRAERLLRKEEFLSNQVSDLVRRRSVIVHGIPASNSSTSIMEHETAQWNYIRHKLGVNAIAANLSRLPRPSHLSSLTAPRLVRITFVSELMASNVLEAWHTKRNELPRDIRIHGDRPRTKKQTLTAGPTPLSVNENVFVSLSECSQQSNIQGPSKNGPQPV